MNASVSPGPEESTSARPGIGSAGFVFLAALLDHNGPRWSMKRPGLLPRSASTRELPNRRCLGMSPVACFRIVGRSNETRLAGFGRLCCFKLSEYRDQ